MSGPIGLPRRAVPAYGRARCTLIYLRKHDTLEQIAAGFRIGVATAWRYVNDAIKSLGAFAPSLTEALTGHHGDGYVPLDGTVAETDQVQSWRTRATRVPRHRHHPDPTQSPHRVERQAQSIEQGPRRTPRPRRAHDRKDQAGSGGSFAMLASARRDSRQSPQPSSPS